jgi:hypothetical protein
MLLDAFCFGLCIVQALEPGVSLACACFGQAWTNSRPVTRLS